MNAEIFADWLRHQGFQVVRSPSSYWVNYGKRVWQAIPFHRLIMPTLNEIRNFFFSYNAVALRYFAPINIPGGCPSYHVVYEKPQYKLENLSKKARYDVRQGMKNSNITTISFKQMAETGWKLQLDTFSRQGRKMPITEDRWRVMCQTASKLPGFDAWGAFVDKQLAAAAFSVTLENCFYILYQMSHRDFLHLKVNNALTFVITSAALKRPSVKLVCYGLHSLDAPSSVDEYKFRMGYIPKPVCQRVVFHPLLQPFVNKSSLWIIRRLLKVCQGNPTLAKAEGMFRFYLLGRNNGNKQILPNCIEARKGELSKFKET